MPDDSAAYAANWLTIVVIDVAMAAAVLAGGVLAVWAGSGWGWPIGGLGAVYAFFAFGRAVKWRRMRRQAGL